MKTFTRYFGAAALVGAAGVGGMAYMHPSGAATVTGPTPRAESVQLVASLSDRKLIVIDNGDTTETYTVAIGNPKKPTPTGSFKIRKIVWNPAWIPPDEKWAKGKKPQPPGAAANPMKVVKIFFQEPDYYIHGTNELGSLGEPDSHGCLRMDPDEAYQLAKYLMDHGGSPRSESWFWRVLHFRSQTQTVYLDNPVPLTVLQ